MIFNDGWFTTKLYQIQEEKRVFSSAISIHGVSPRPIRGTREEEEHQQRIIRNVYGTGDRYKTIFRQYTYIKKVMQTICPIFVELPPLFNSLLYCEWVSHIHQPEKFYRDHFTHAVKVALLGDWFLDMPPCGNALVFSIDSKFQNNLDSNSIPEDLRQEFENNGITLSSNTTVSIVDKDSVWAMKNKDNKQRYCCIRKEEDKLNVYNVIFNIVANLLRENNEIFDWLPLRGWRSIDWLEVTELSWWMAGLFHDIAYPLELYHKIGKKISPGYKELDILGSNWEMVQPQIHDSLLFSLNDKEDIKNAFEERKHGACGAVQLLCLSKKSSSMGYNERLAVELAANAIFNHHRIDDYDFSFDKDPISYLLLVADNCQEWGRLLLIPEENKDDYIKLHRYYISDKAKICSTSNPEEYKVIFFFKESEISKINRIPDEIFPDKYKWDEAKVRNSKEKFHSKILTQVNGKFPRISYNLKRI